MIAIDTSIVENILINDWVTVDKIITDSKARIVSFIANPSERVKGKDVPITLSAAQRQYLSLLEGQYEKIVMAVPKELDGYKNQFDSIINWQDMSLPANVKFRNELINRMGYKTLRNDFYPGYFEKLQIKACVYCNCQFALTVRRVNGKKIAKFQVDHALPKAEYPCFSISFYNLYPTCGPCNNSKSRSNISFILYSADYNDYQSSKFQFELDKTSLIRYKVNWKDSDLKIKFEDRGSGLNKALSIESVYNTQKDIAEELVLKSMIYNKAYKQSLSEALTKLYKHKVPMLERLIIGNYLEEKDIHKRPMAKFTQDIARQLKLI